MHLSKVSTIPPWANHLGALHEALHGRAPPLSGCWRQHLVPECHVAGVDRTTSRLYVWNLPPSLRQRMHANDARGLQPTETKLDTKCRLVQFRLFFYPERAFRTVRRTVFQGIMMETKVSCCAIGNVYRQWILTLEHTCLIKYPWTPTYFTDSSTNKGLHENHPQRWARQRGALTHTLRSFRAKQRNS